MPVTFELANPEGLAFDGAGGLLVVESGAGRLLRVHLATGAIYVSENGHDVLTRTWPR